MSNYLIGIDEAGYGPSLGPLVVTAVVFQTPSPDIDLWKSLNKVTSNKSYCPNKIPVCDSKAIYQPNRGIKALETAVLAFASLIAETVPNSLTIKQFIQKVHYGDIDRISSLPWYEKYAGIPIPLKADKKQISELSGRLKNECREKSIRFEKVSCRMIDADGFNNALAKGNKAELLFDITAELLTDLCKTYLQPDNHLEISIGKQGGRTYYQEHIEKVFMPHKIQRVKEKSNCSWYTISAERSVVPKNIGAGRENNCTIKFLKDGEDKEFTIALASMFCKYLRELGMKMFNNFWQEHSPTLKPTAGYYKDSQRFISEIKPLTTKLGLPPENFVRLRS
jgi:ribonuclease HII